jgi:hypothetical protein
VENFEVVHVFTLGGASWRSVSTPGASCNLKHGIVSIDGTMFWVRGGDRVIMSLDLEHECLTSTKSLPAQNETVRYLVEVHGRLGIATATVDFYDVNKIQVLLQTL